MINQAPVRSVVWPRAGVSEVVDAEEPRCGPDDAVVDVSVSVLSPGTERARLLGLPTAAVSFPHVPGYQAAGLVRSAPALPAGTRVAVRGAGHRSVAVVPAQLVYPVANHIPLIDAAVWQLAITALYGLALGEHQPGEPVTVIGAGLLGVITRRLAAARGAPSVQAVASSHAKAWAVPAEPATSFMLIDRVRVGSPLVIEVTGSPAGLAAAIGAAAHGARVVLLGSPRSLTADIPLQRAYDRGLTIVGAHTANLADTEEHALTEAFFCLLDVGRFTVADVLDQYPAHDAPLAYRRLIADRAFIGAALLWDQEHANPSTGAGRRDGRRYGG